MKKNFLIMSLFVLGMCGFSASCSDDNDYNEEKDITLNEAANLDYSSANSAAWTNYALRVAQLLRTDATALHSAWTSSFANAFKNHTEASGYTSAANCTEEIMQGCIDIANEVGTAKIGEPYDFYKAGKTTEALYAVESWYSWHSRDDYKNNIKSIANAMLGTCLTETSLTEAQKSKADANSIIAKCLNSGNANLQKAADDVWTNTVRAWEAIDEIPQPFRNNIASPETETAMDACAELVASLEKLQGLVNNLSEEDCQGIVDRFVDAVALPTYADLQAKNEALYNAVDKLRNNPSNSTFSAACTAWLNARQPWETSEAFLFGPVAELGLDPNMDSWPLDQVGIANVIKSQKWTDLEWDGDYDEESENIEAAQSLRGFHTLEFLLFKNGTPRTVQ